MKLIISMNKPIPLPPPKKKKIKNPFGLIFGNKEAKEQRLKRTTFTHTHTEMLFPHTQREREYYCVNVLISKCIL